MALSFFIPLPPRRQDYSEVEITHCRAAMLAFGGIITQSALFETGFPYVNTNMNVM